MYRCTLMALAVIQNKIFFECVQASFVIVKNSQQLGSIWSDLCVNLPLLLASNRMKESKFSWAFLIRS